MRCLRQFLALWIVLLFLVVFPCAMWTFHAQRIMLDSNTYAQAFQDEGFYSDLQPRVLPALLRDLDTPDETSTTAVTLLTVIEHLDSRAWSQIAPQLVPLSWVEFTVETNVDAAIAWLDGDAPTLEIIFRTETMRRRLEGTEGDRAVSMIAEALPPCDAEAEAQFAAYVAGEADVMFPYCQPADATLHSDLIALIDQARRVAVDQFPQDLNVVDEMRRFSAEEIAASDGGIAHEPFTDQDLDDFRFFVRFWKRMLPVTLLVPVTLLSIIVIFAVRSFKSFFRWMGWSLILGCVLTLTPLFFLPFFANETHFQGDLESGFATGGALIAEVMGDRMVEIVIGQFTWPVLTQSAVLLVIGFIFVVLSVLVNDPDAPADLYITPQGLPVYQTPSGQLVYVDSTGTPVGTPVGLPVGTPTPGPAITPSPTEPPPDASA